MLVGCGDKKTDNNDPDSGNGADPTKTTVPVNVIEASNMGDVFGNKAVQLYAVQFQTSGVDSETKLGKGHTVTITLSATYVDGATAPANKEYSVVSYADGLTYNDIMDKVWATDMEEFGAYSIIEEAVEGATKVTPIEIVGGSITVASDGWTMALEADNGKTYNFKSGAITYEDNTPDPYPGEPTAKTVNETITGGQASGAYYGAWYTETTANWEVAFADADGSNGFNADLLGPISGASATVITDGTYNIAATGADFTAMPAEYNSTYGPLGTYVIYNGEVFYMVSGTVVVNGTTVTLSGTSGKGSNITISWTGTAPVIQDKSAAPSATVRKATMKTKKSFLN